MQENIDFSLFRINTEMAAGNIFLLWSPIQLIRLEYGPSNPVSKK